MIIATRICDLLHPEYTTSLSDWEKWRLTYKGGDHFIRRYLYQFNRRENNLDHYHRRLMTYCPAFAKAALNDVKNSIYQRLVDITREDGPLSYQAAIMGKLGGVDLLGSSMNSFIGREVLPDLLSMSKIGVFVDMPPLFGPTIADKGDLHPYLYTYKVEDFRNWCKDESANRNEYTSILLKDINYEYDENTGLPIGEVIQYRRMWVADDGFVHVIYYDEKNNPVTNLDYADLNEETGEITLKINRIPFVTFELSSSLLEDAANYQIALLNLSSTAFMYALKSSFPFYTEQFDPRQQNPYIKKEGEEGTDEIRVGLSAGRRYLKDLDRPGFINPSPEPLRANMELADRLKAEIRQLINLAITNLQPKMASAESKAMDNGSLEAGLSCIGLELENGERKIADFWAMYEGKKSATVTYPENYSLTSQTDRHNKAKVLQDLMSNVPSLTYQREIAKQIAVTMLGSEISIDKLKQIKSEIDTAPVVIGDPKIISTDLQNGLVSAEMASRARGYPPGQVKLAEVDHAERLARIAAAQSPGGFNAQARGVSDLSADPSSGKAEKAQSRDTTAMPVPVDTTRGEGK